MAAAPSFVGMASRSVNCLVRALCICQVCLWHKQHWHASASSIGFLWQITKRVTWAGFHWLQSRVGSASLQSETEQGQNQSNVQLFIYQWHKQCFTCKLGQVSKSKCKTNLVPVAFKQAECEGKIPTHWIAVEGITDGTVVWRCRWWSVRIFKPLLSLHTKNKEQDIVNGCKLQETPLHCPHKNVSILNSENFYASVFTYWGFALQFLFPLLIQQEINEKRQVSFHSYKYLTIFLHIIK